MIDRISRGLRLRWRVGARNLRRFKESAALERGSRVYPLQTKQAVHPIYLRPGSSDRDVFGQIFIGDEYRCIRSARNVRTVVDLGANVGMSSAYFLSRFPGCFVVAVEPDPGNYEALSRNLQPYGNRVEAIRAAVWHDHEGLVVDRSFGDGREWARQVRPTSGSGADGIRVMSITMEQIITRLGGRRIGLLKVDIEGAELSLFRGDTPWLSLVDRIVIELHGRECEQVFHGRVSDREWRKSTCDELTVCERVSLSR